MDDDIGAELDGAADDRRGERAVDDQGNPVFMGNVGYPPYVGHVSTGIADGFDIERSGLSKTYEVV